MNKFKFDGRITHSRGRNGNIQTTGLSVWKAFNRLDDKNRSYETIRIYPITSYDKEGNCFLEIPVPELENLIKVLQEYVQSQP